MHFDQKRLGFALFAFVALLGASAGCGDVLGIEDATCNPSLPACQNGSLTGGDLCQEYCSTVMQNCTGAFQVYVGRETCLSVCKLLPEGQAGDEKVNSVQCRLGQAKLAGEIPEPAIHCSAAGPGGNNLCGDNCESICTITQGACTGEHQQFQSVADCAENCSGVPTAKAADGNEYYDVVAKEMSSGNSRQCRLWHASVATQSPDPHCTHAGGASPCR
jgi:hypothetical protein